MYMSRVGLRRGADAGAGLSAILSNDAVEELPLPASSRFALTTPAQEQVEAF